MLISLCVSFLLNHQPAKALPYFLRLRRPDVFNLIRQHNLFAAVQDQVLLLVEFDVELDHSPEKAVDTTERQVLSPGGKHGKAIELLVDHVHSIPVRLARPFAAPLPCDLLINLIARPLDRSRYQAARCPAKVPLHVP